MEVEEVEVDAVDAAGDAEDAEVAVEADTDTVVAGGTLKAVAADAPKAARPDRCALADTVGPMCTSAVEAGEAVAAALLPQQAAPAPAAEGVVTSRPRALSWRRFKSPKRRRNSRASRLRRSATPTNAK